MNHRGLEKRGTWTTKKINPFCVSSLRDHVNCNQNCRVFRKGGVRQPHFPYFEISLNIFVSYFSAILNVFRKLEGRVKTGNFST